MGYSGYYAKGGKLSEKEAIAIEKENNKKIEKHQDRVLKNVLNNSKLIEKALIKVFK
jgi:demethoxyubiquinone hydroxylase (CLK1/Coq7/Cat5 family)